VESYLHSLTHELKSPLAAIQGTAELLDEEMPKRDQKRFIANIRRESERLHQVVEQLLCLAAVEKQQVLRDPVAVDSNALITSLCEERAWRLQPKGIHFKTQLIDKPKPSAEMFLLQQAMGNLIDNAIDFSPLNGLITLDSRVEDGKWLFTVRDQGPGIPDYALQRVYERFFSLARPDGGSRSSGLGLSFVREVANLHGGRVTLKNGRDGGAEAQLVLPL
jgi:two-component system sensor histidine kinase CreC